MSVPENDHTISTTNEYDRLTTMAVVLRYENSVSTACIIVVKMTSISDWDPDCIRAAHQANIEALQARVVSTNWNGPPTRETERVVVSVVWHPDEYYKYLIVSASTSRL